MQLRMARSAQHHLVLLPGLDGTGQLFDPLLSVLPSTFEVSIVRYPTDRTASFRDLFGCIRSVIPWDRPYVVVAESSAGPLALRFVEAQRNDIRAVVLAASFVSNPFSFQPSADPLKWATSIFSKPWLEKEPTPDLIRKHLLGEDAPDLLVDRAMEVLRSLKPEVWSSRVQMVLNADARRELQSCEKPILSLQATEDQFVSASATEEIKRLKPSVKTVTIKGPHALLQRNPREVIEAIRAFLAELPPA
jgi:pimeloyl-ACP methyl ester carboxylesterase